MDKLFKTQLKILNNIMNFYNNSTKLPIDKQTLSHFEARLELLENYWKGFQERHEELSDFEEQLKDEDYFKLDGFMIAEENYINAKSKIREKIKELTPPSAVNREANFHCNSNSHKDIKLPPLDLPIFSGKHEE